MMETTINNLNDVKWGSHSWRDKAACKGVDTEEFFKEQVPKAKKICDKCDVKNDCLQFALSNDIGWGIYGGMTARERRKAFKNVVSKR